MKLKFLFIAFVLLVFANSVSLAESAEGKTIRLENYWGEVAVMSGAGNSVKVTKKMRVFDGYTVITSKDSTAYLSIDNKKSIKLDQNTKVSIVKKDNVNEIQVLTGAIFFSVKEKLKDTETLDVVTPTMAIGIRGTTGTVSFKKEKSHTQIYSGKVVVKDNKGKENIVASGQEIRDVKENTKEDKKEFEIVSLDIGGQDIPSFSLNEINNDKEIKKQIEQEKVFEVNNFVKAEKENKEKEKIEQKQELKEIEEKKEEAKNQKVENKIEITNEILTIIKPEIEVENNDQVENEEKNEEEIKEEIKEVDENTKTENKELNEEYKVIEKGESIQIEGYEGDLYVFEVNDKTGTAELKETIEFSGDLKIENSNKGSINVQNNNKTENLGGSGYEGAYKVVED